MKRYIFILLAAGFLASGCNSNVLVDSFQTLPEEGWLYQDIVTDSFEVTEPGFYHQVSANLRLKSDYPYANIHLAVSITYPDSTASDYKVPIELAEKSGNWLGSGLGDVITFQVPILHRKVLNQKGKYTVTMAQDMRLESLPNIVSTGLRVEQQEEIY